MRVLNMTIKAGDIVKDNSLHGYVIIVDEPINDMCNGCHTYEDNAGSFTKVKCRIHLPRLLIAINQGDYTLLSHEESMELKLRLL
jgi:hypothetical protein